MRRLALALGVAVCVLVPSSLFLGRYVVSDTGVAPAGSDTSQHVWRSEVVAELGLEALPAFEGRSQALNTNADRPGLPLVLSFLSAVTGADARDLAYVFPGVAAAAIALAAAALAGAIPGVPGWGIAAVGVATGASVHVAFAANGYLDQLLVEPLLLLTGACALRAAAGGPGRALGAAALVAAWLVHWQFALLFTLLLGVVALASLPASLRDRRQGRPFAETASGRVGTTIAGGAGLGAVALLLGTPGILARRSGCRAARWIGTSRCSSPGTGCPPKGSRPWWAPPGWPSTTKSRHAGGRHGCSSRGRSSRRRRRSSTPPVARCRFSEPCPSRWRSPFSAPSAWWRRSCGCAGGSGTSRPPGSRCWRSPR